MYVHFDALEAADVHALFGQNDRNVRLLETTFGVTIITRDDSLKVTGEETHVAQAGDFLKSITNLASRGVRLNEEELKSAISVYKEDKQAGFEELFSKKIQLNFAKKNVSPKSLSQKRYLKAMEDNDLVIGIGPAGTGKTYLAVAKAIQALSKREVERIVLTRPAVEAGEHLGFLPGDLMEKVNPYLRPLYDALFDLLDRERTLKFMEKGIIEIAPLAYMRGRTLSESFIIMDEAQNTTSQQMKMFLTRLGQNSKAVITGDITQVDLPAGKISGLIEIQKILKAVKDIQFVYFTEKDVIRHELVRNIIKAYDKYENRKQHKSE